MDEFEYEQAIKMIDRVYKTLFMSDEIVGKKGNVYNKYDNIRLYIDKLTRIHQRLKVMPNYLDKVRKLFYDSYIIKPQNISDDYLRKLIRGDYGGFKKINLSDELKLEYQTKIINDQKSSLDNWINYFFSSETDLFPMWVKFWAFQGMLKLGTFNKETNTFNRRSKNNISNFADLNKEALNLTMIFIRKRIKKDLIEDHELDLLLKSGSFKKIYEYMLKYVSSKHSNSELFDGLWVKYPQGNDCVSLVNSLQGYNTEWCITGVATAMEQLSSGDFYIYYTRDNNGEYKIPRIAIRMQGDVIINEICGIARGQNIEEGFEDVIVDKIASFPDISFSDGLNQLKRLTCIHKKVLNNQALSLDDLMFIYEINENINGVVPKKDPRINEIIRSRDIRSDLALIFNCSEDNIALSEDELLERSNDIVCLYGNLTLYNTVVFPKLKFIYGNLKCSYETNASAFKELKRVTGDMIFDSLVDASYFKNLVSIGKDCEFPLLKNSNGFDSLVNIGGSAYFPELKEAYHFKGLASIGLNSFFPKYSYAFFPLIISPIGFNNLRVVKGDFICSSLNTLDGFDSLFSIRGKFIIPLIKDIDKLESMHIYGNVTYNSQHHL